MENENARPNPYVELLTEVAAEFMTLPRAIALNYMTKIVRLGLVIREEKHHDLLENLTQQLESLARKFEQGSLSEEGIKVSFELDENYFDLERSTVSLEQVLHLELTEEDTEEFAKNMERVTDKFIQDSIKNIFVPSRVEVWKASAENILESERNAGIRVSQNIQGVWGKALHLLEMLTSICLGLGEDFNEKYRVIESNAGNSKFAVLTRLHARGCQVSQEIFFLLKSGFADGALARWRTLDEIAVIATYIAQQDNVVAEQYMDHVHVKKWQVKVETLAHFESMGLPPATAEEVELIDRNYKEVMTKYGRSFAGNYGWAATSLGIKGPTLHDIEEKIGWTQNKYYYNMANHNVHADVTGILFRLSSVYYTDELITGQSIFGLSEPGYNTATSILLLTSALVFSDEQDDSYVIDMMAANEIREEVYEAFGLADEQLGKLVDEHPKEVD